MKTFQIKQTRTYTTYIVVKGKTLQEVEGQLHGGGYDDELGYQELEQMNTDDYETKITLLTDAMLEEGGLSPEHSFNKTI
tara:strand:+ start:174 stop:413 length:240 start_codon:yes stop_codon:yes gene_type:complete